MTSAPPHLTPRHVPERSCAACRRRRPQADLLRFTRQDGVWTLQQTRRTGRGTYLCADTPACWAEKRLKRAFGAQAATLSAALQVRADAGRTVPPEHT